MLGPPGAGKPRLARRLATILPAMTLAKVVETTGIQVVTALRFHALHRAISDVGMLGGGHLPMPGEVSLAHHGSWTWMRGPSARAMSSRS